MLQDAPQCVPTLSTLFWKDDYKHFGCLHYENQVLTVLYEFAQIPVEHGASQCAHQMQRFGKRLYETYMEGLGRFLGVKSDPEYMGLQFSFKNQPITMLSAMKKGRFNPEALKAVVTFTANQKTVKLFLTHAHSLESWCYNRKDPSLVYYVNFQGVAEDLATMQKHRVYVAQDDVSRPEPVMTSSETGPIYATLISYIYSKDENFSELYEYDLQLSRWVIHMP